MGCGASKGGASGGIEPEQIKSDVEEIMERHFDPLEKDFEEKVFPKLTEAGMPSWAEEDKLAYDKCTEVRKSVWDANDFAKRSEDAKALAEKDLESEVWPDIDKKLPPAGMKRTIGEKVARKAMEAARDGAVKSFTEGCLESPLINGLLKDNIKQIAEKHAKPYVDGGFKDLQQKKLAAVEKKSLDDFASADEFKKFHKECVKESETPEEEAAALADFDEEVIPVILRRVAWKGTPLDSLKGKAIVAGLGKGKVKMVKGAIAAVIAGSEKDRIDALEKKDAEASGEAKEEDSKGEESSKGEDSKGEDAKEEDAKEEDAKEDDAKEDDAKEDDAKEDDAKEDDAKEDDAKEDDAKEEE